MENLKVNNARSDDQIRKVVDEGFIEETKSQKQSLDSSISSINLLGRTPKDA